MIPDYDQFLKQLNNHSTELDHKYYHEGIWQYYHCGSASHTDYKLHVSCGLNDLAGTVHKLGIYLLDSGIDFKVVDSYSNCQKLNTGEYGYNQIGKQITIYCHVELNIGQFLKDIISMTNNISGSLPPTDARIDGSNCISLRYTDSNRHAINSDIIQKWNQRLNHKAKLQIETPKKLPDKYIYISTVSKRGAGGRFRALDYAFSKRTGKPCSVFLKEGIRYAEKGFDGIDAYQRLLNQIEKHKLLQDKASIPKCLDSLIYNDRVIGIFSWIDGTSLSELNCCSSTMSVHIATQILETILIPFHKEGICAIDISPDNFILENSAPVFVDLDDSQFFNSTSFVRGKVSFEIPFHCPISPKRDIYLLMRLLYYMRYGYQGLRDIDLGNINLQNDSILYEWSQSISRQYDLDWSLSFGTQWL